MTIPLSIASALIISFVAWLFYSSRKKINRPSYTQGKEKKELTDLDGMLANITQKEQTPEKEKPREDEDADEHENKEEKKEVSYHQDFDPKQAIIGSVILERKNKKH